MKLSSLFLTSALVMAFSLPAISAPAPRAAAAAPSGYEWCVAPLSVHTLPNGSVSCF